MWAEQCDKSRSLSKFGDTLISIGSFKKKYVIIKGVLQYEPLEQYIVYIGVYPSFKNNTVYKHTFLDNIKKLYKYSDKCENGQQFKSIIDEYVVSTT